VWPEALEVAIGSIETADFLDRDQKRDILYNNAARFLHLSQDQIADTTESNPVARLGVYGPLAGKSGRDLGGSRVADESQRRCWHAPRPSDRETLLRKLLLHRVRFVPEPCAGRCCHGYSQSGWRPRTNPLFVPASRQRLRCRTIAGLRRLKQHREGRWHPHGCSRWRELRET